MSKKQPKRKPRPGLDEYGRTPLHYAAADGLADEVSRLLSTGADTNAQDDDGWTPLHFAAQANSSAVTAALLSAGANTELKDSYGNTPLFNAVFASQGDGTVIQLLINAGANPNAANLSDVTPLSLAKSIANYNISQFFD